MNSERKKEKEEEEELDQLVPPAHDNNQDNDIIEDDMDLVNAPNPWLPAYGFQLQNHYKSGDDDIDNQRSNNGLFFSLFYIYF